jgi:hypothetical protein
MIKRSPVHHKLQLVTASLMLDLTLRTYNVRMYDPNAPQRTYLINFVFDLVGVGKFNLDEMPT